MANIIDIKRADIKQYFDKNALTAGNEKFCLSEDGIYYFVSEQYRQNDPNSNWEVTLVQIGHIEKNGFFFEYIADHDDICFLWVYKNNKDYLLLPEFQGGQSIFDIEERKLYSFFTPDDPFIWTSIYVSPDKTKLAVTGCYFACPYEFVVYDCSNITELPYTCIYRKPLDKYNEIHEWEDNKTIVLKTTNGKEKQLVEI
ncbi:MAG: hypothetical protein WAS56_13125 [Saprospiraceae bacterium]